MRKIILASKSPRRREILQMAGFTFDIIPAVGEEVATGDTPDEIVEQLALQKAEEVFNIYLDRCTTPEEKEGFLVIGADTVVAVDGEILGKPKDKEDAYRMIQLIQGRVHQVYTGFVFVFMQDGQMEVHIFNECTQVECYPMTEEEIWHYVNQGTLLHREEVRENEHENKHFDWEDKAGGYAIQNVFGKYIKGIKGDYYNVVGLPISRLYQEIKNIDN
ncbi:MAG: Maf-like protein [Lachnospiraceae bacterium]|nr:Maf-like protein [Lachnospiraceae bacterium]